MTIITYEKVFQNSQIANSLIGMSLAEFEELYAAFEQAHIARQNALQHTQRHEHKRKRTVGAGRKHKYTLRDRLLMTLFWLRAYTTYEVLGCIYDLNKTSVEDNLKNVLDTLTTMTTFRFELPPTEVPRLRSVQEVVDAFPDLRLIMKADE